MAALDWTPELTQSVLDCIEAGRTLRQVKDDTGVSAWAILRKVRADESFAQQYARAMEMRSDNEFEALIDGLDEEPERTERGIDPAWVQLKRLKVDTIKWALSKRVPKKYGDTIQHEHSGELGIKAILVPAIARTTEKPMLKPAFAQLEAPKEEEC